MRRAGFGLCFQGTWSRVDGQPLQRIFYELYQDRDAFDAHEQTEHTRRFLAAREELLTSVEVDWLELQSGKGTTP
jgi:quinol monooxygenase YgiN